jgi:adenine deaminase
MAQVANQLTAQQGGWVLVREGEVVATVRLEVGGLMTSRPAAELDAEMQHLYREGEKVDWMFEYSHARWFPGFPERLIFATLTCSPWRWVLVAPCADAPQGFVNVQTGATHPVVW